MNTRVPQDPKRTASRKVGQNIAWSYWVLSCPAEQLHDISKDLERLDCDTYRQSATNGQVVYVVACNLG